LTIVESVNKLRCNQKKAGIWIKIKSQLSQTS